MAVIPIGAILKHRKPVTESLAGPYAPEPIADVWDPVLRTGQDDAVPVIEVSSARLLVTFSVTVSPLSNAARALALNH